MRVFVSDQDMNHATVASAAMTVDLPVNAVGNLTNSAITGLTSGKGYYFRIGLIDEAGNLVQHFPDMTGLSSSDANCMAPSPDPVNCVYAAIPK
jgi:hypothetical protein